tara:strand:+ start:6498 stop:7166 length:669 start_codon:yes stop_codon:yes gene_type:complete
MRLNVNVPTELNEITLGQYQKFLKIDQNNEKSNFINQKMIEIFCKVKIKDVLLMKLNDIKTITNLLNKMFNREPNLVKTFYMNGKEYGFINNLDEISFGEYIDLDINLSNWQDLHKAMNVLYRPIISKFNNKYSIEKYNVDNPHFMKNMPMDAVLSSIIFFYHLGNDLLKATLNYSLNNQKIHTILDHNLIRSGVGINQYMDLLKETLDNLIKLPNYQYTNA